MSRSCVPIATRVRRLPSRCQPLGGHGFEGVLFQSPRVVWSVCEGREGRGGAEGEARMKFKVEVVVVI